MGCFITKINKAKANNQKPFVIVPAKFIRENQSKVIEVYTFGNLIGEGTYGKVYLVTHKTTKQQRAIKIINKRNIRDTKLRFKFINEIAILKVLDHPNILKLYEFFEDDRNYYLVTDYLSGGELLDYIIKNVVLSEYETAKYIRQLLESAYYLHSQSIIHRDIKLNNLMLESSHPDALLKLIDFGTSVIQTRKKKLKNRKGTIAYIAPEVIDNTYNEKCDIWSIGVIMYILLSGKMPFGGSNDEEIIMSIKQGSYSLKGKQWDAISPQAKDLINNLLCYDPKKRFSAEQGLDHDWFRLNKNTNTLNNEIISEVLNNLRSFRATFKLQRAVMSFIVSQLISQAEKQELSQVFKALDINGNGKLTEDELFSACTKVWGHEVKFQDIKNIINEIDIDGNGIIDYSEFLIASINRQKLLTTERLEIVFQMFDKDGSGKITAKELKEMVDYHDIDEYCWENLISEVNSNQEGEVTLKEFKDMMLAIL
jgi:calcium-dependent protein kinase